jgi:hypothetical protein
MTRRGLRVAFVFALVSSAAVVLAGDDLPTQFSNMGSIGNTRHNMTQRQASGGGPNGSLMDPVHALNVDPLLPIGCLSCHQPGIRAAATDFSAAYIGTDLRNDHPVGVTFPTSFGPGTDWKQPTGSFTQGITVSKFFDDNSNGRPDKNEIRLYDSALGPQVECASCHDPHGVPSSGAGSMFNPTFLRKPNAASAVCLTCHTK